MPALGSWATPREARTRKAAVAAAMCLFAWMALLPIHDGAAQERRSPAPEKPSPLSSAAESSAHAQAASSPAASAGGDRRPVSAAPDDSDGGVPLVTLTLLALVTAGMMVTFAGIGRRRREGEQEVAAAPPPPRPVKVAEPAMPLWHGRSDRFSGAATTAAGRTTATVAMTEQRGGGDPRSPERDSAPAPAADEPSSADPAAAAGTPPTTHVAWTAEIEWRQVDGTARFRVIARGPGTITLAQSPPLEWPPSGPAAVQATTDAAEELAATLEAAGWKALPPGPAWYAKRFAWEPVAAKAPAGAKAAPSNGVAGAKPPAARGEAGAPERDRSRLARWKQLAWLGTLVAIGFIVALQLNGVAGGGSTTRRDEGIDLSVLLLGLAAVLLLILIITRIRRALR